MSGILNSKNNFHADSIKSRRRYWSHLMTAKVRDQKEVPIRFQNLESSDKYGTE
jgi:hypothetical protein